MGPVARNAQVTRSGLPAASLRIRRAPAGWLFVLPLVIVFVLFVGYPLVAGVVMSLQAGNFQRLFGDPLYERTVFNTLLFVVVSVNVKMILSLALSGYLSVRSPAAKVVNALYLLPWAVPVIPTILSWRWMLNSEWGLLNEFLWLAGFEPVFWLVRYETAIGSAMAFHIWKYTPLWTLIFLAGRKGIPAELYEAAAIDGASAWQNFRYVTYPMLARLHGICTLLSTVWTMGDFVIIWLLTGGGPADSTHVLATLAYRYAFQMARVGQGVAVFTSALPLTLLLILILLRRFGVARS